MTRRPEVGAKIGKLKKKRLTRLTTLYRIYNVDYFKHAAEPSSYVASNRSARTGGRFDCVKHVGHYSWLDHTFSYAYFGVDPYACLDETLLRNHTKEEARYLIESTNWASLRRLGTVITKKRLKYVDMSTSQRCAAANVPTDLCSTANYKVTRRYAALLVQDTKTRAIRYLGRYCNTHAYAFFGDSIRDFPAIDVHGDSFALHEDAGYAVLCDYFDMLDAPLTPA